MLTFDTSIYSYNNKFYIADIYLAHYLYSYVIIYRKCLQWPNSLKYNSFLDLMSFYKNSEKNTGYVFTQYNSTESFTC